jgi:hypothetical protein
VKGVKIMKTKKIILIAVTILINCGGLLSQVYENGSCLSGNCSNGQGSFAYESGDIYTGSFSQNKRNGYGEYTFKSGTVYKGNWTNDLKQDKKALYISKAIQYIGSFENDYISGYGTLEYLLGDRAGNIYRGEFKNNKFNGQGVLTFKNGEKWEGLWINDVFQGTIIGSYKDNPVYKKGDTIVTYNNKYLLSKQTPLPNNGYNVLLNDNVLQDGFFIGLDTKGQKQIIGYVTTTSQRSNSSIVGEAERFAKNAENCKFKAIECDRQKELYKKFIPYCDARIKKWDNTVNVFSKTVIDYEKTIAEDTDLNNRIIRSKLSDITIQVVSDLLDAKIHDKIAKLSEGSRYEDLIADFGFDPFNTKTKDYLIEKFTDILLIGHKEPEIVKAVKDCGTKIMKAAYKSINNSTEKDNLDMTIADWVKDKARDKDHNRLETEEAKFFKAMRDMIDDCIPSEAAYPLKKSWIYHVFKNLPEAGEATGLTIANVVIKYSMAPETKKMFENYIRESKEKRDFLINLKRGYAQLLTENRQGECQAYFEIINDMYEKSKNPVGAEHIADELSRLHTAMFK